MPEVFDWRTVPDPDDAVRAVLAALGAGRLVILPTEAGYVVAADARSPGAAEGLRQLLPENADPWSVGLSTEAVVRQWVPGLGPVGRRLARRLWPGPVTLMLPGSAADRLSEAVRGPAVVSDSVSLRCPAHEAVREVLADLPDSVLLADAPAVETAEPVTGARLAEALGERVAVVIDGGAVLSPVGTTVVSLAGDRWQVLREGVVSAAVVQRQTVCLIVFVCTGNTCRSPMAEALCKKRLSDRLGCRPEELSQRGFLVLSAGLSAYAGGPPAAEAVEVAAGYGADLSGHRSRPMTAELLFQADHVVGMTRDHVEALAEASAGLTEPPRLLSPAGDDLSDPVGRERAVYEECAAAVWRHLDVFTAEILPPSPPNP
jgi:protein-tyrosine phosphatase